MVIVALQIAYLPALYAAFSRREGLVSLLESRAGLPAWGPELLARHQLVGISDTLPELYAAWEEWAADVAESHTTYPILLLFRSPEPWYSWLIGLLSVLDGAAMHLSLAPSTASSQARLCLRMGFTLVNRVATTLGWPVDPDPNPDGPIELTFEEFERAVLMLESVGFPMERSAEEAWPDFRGWRVNYERLDLPVGRPTDGAAVSVVRPTSPSAVRSRRAQATPPTATGRRAIALRGASRGGHRASSAGIAGRTADPGGEPRPTGAHGIDGVPAPARVRDGSRAC